MGVLAVKIAVSVFSRLPCGVVGDSFVAVISVELE